VPSYLLERKKGDKNSLKDSWPSAIKIAYSTDWYEMVRSASLTQNFTI
jgi:hypothetical protein